MKNNIKGNREKFKKQQNEFEGIVVIAKEKKVDDDKDIEIEE